MITDFKSNFLLKHNFICFVLFRLPRRNVMETGAFRGSYFLFFFHEWITVIGGWAKGFFDRTRRYPA